MSVHIKGGGTTDRRFPSLPALLLPSSQTREGCLSLPYPLCPPHPRQDCGNTPSPRHDKDITAIPPFLPRQDMSALPFLPFPPRQATQQAVCLLQSCRRTFLLPINLQVHITVHSILFSIWFSYHFDYAVT